jgi:uncharacterized protein (DUF2141 family)
MRRLALVSVVLALPAAAADLGVVVTGIAPETGDIRVLVKPEAVSAEAVQELAANRSGAQASAKFVGLAPGEYEVVVQDLAARSIGRGRVSLAEPSTNIAVALAPVSQGEVPIHPNAVEWHRRLR